LTGINKFVCILIVDANVMFGAELEERARLLKQRLNMKQSDNTTPVPFSDSEVSGHRSRPRDSRKASSRGVSGDGGRADSAQRDISCRVPQTADRSAGRYSTRLRDELTYRRPDRRHGG
jgi:hypothetical protein